MLKQFSVSPLLQVILLAACLVASGCTTTRPVLLDPPPDARGERIPPGSRVMIVLNDGSKVRGEVLASSDAGVTIVPRSSAAAARTQSMSEALRGGRPGVLPAVQRHASSQERFIPYSQIQSLDVRSLSPIRTALAIAGVVLVAAVGYLTFVLPYVDCGGYGKVCVS